MRDESHKEQIERWARFVKNNPHNWRIRLKPFLDSQMIIAWRFYEKLLKTEGGGEKFKKIRNLPAFALNKKLL